MAALVSRLRRGRSGLGKIFEGWENAKANSQSYDSQIILHRVREAARLAGKSESTTNIIERDGSALPEQELQFPLMSCLLRSALRAGGKLTILDFGGSLGSTYRQCEGFLSEVVALRWHIVEQKNFVDCGRAEFESTRLRFFETIEEALAAGPPDVIIFSSVLQYLDDPYDVLMQAVRATPAAIIIDRTPVGGSKNDAFTVQHVPAAIYPVTLAFRIFGRNNFVDYVAPLYCKVTEFAALDPDMFAGSMIVRFRGYLFEKAS